MNRSNIFSILPLPQNVFFKICVSCVYIALAIYFLPFIIGSYIAYFLYKHVSHKFIRYGIMTGVLVPTFLVGSGWVAGFSGTKVTSSSRIIAPTVLPTQSVQISTPAPTQTPTPQVSPSPTAVSTNTPFPTFPPTAIVVPTTLPKRIFTPTIHIVPTYNAPPAVVNVADMAPAQTTSGGYGCDCSKTCTQIFSCAEAQYQLNVCGCGRRDGDNDGTACDGAPLNCQ